MREHAVRPARTAPHGAEPAAPIWRLTGNGTLLRAVLLIGATGAGAAFGVLVPRPAAPLGSGAAAAVAEAPNTGSGAESALRSASAPVAWKPDLLPDPMAAGRAYAEVGADGREPDELELSPARAPEEPVLPAASSAPPSAAPAPALPDPVRRFSLDEAARMPLLVLARGARVIFHETVLGATADPDRSIEGEWAVLGRCGVPLRLDLAQPVRAAGQVRGIGRGEGAPVAAPAVAVPRHACAHASGLWRPAVDVHAAQAAPRAAWKAGFASLGDPDRVVSTPSGAVHWFRLRTPTGGLRVVAVRQDATGGSLLWDSAASESAGPLADAAWELLALYRRGHREEAWLVATEPGRARWWVRVVRTETGAWWTESLVPLDG